MNKYIKLVSIFGLVIGNYLMINYFSNVELGNIIYLFCGVFIVSLSGLLSIITLEEKKSDAHFIFFLFFSSFLLFTMYRIRFNNLPPGDIIFEYRTARSTYEDLYWNINRVIFERYFSSMCISLIPTIISIFTGLEIIDLFTYGFKLIAALIPVSLYLLLNQVFNNKKISATSSLIFSQLYFNIIKLMNLTRQQFAEWSLIILFYIYFKLHNDTKNENRLGYFIIMIIAILNIIIFHYTINYFSIAIFLFLLIFKYVFRFIPASIKKDMSLPYKYYDNEIVKIVVILFSFSLLWWSTINIDNFIKDVINELKIFDYRNIEPAYQVSFIASSPLGPYVTFWIQLLAVMSVFGFILLFLLEKKDGNLLRWMISGGIMYLLLAIWLTPNQSITGVYPDRVFIIGYIFFSSYIGYLLIKIWNIKYLKILYIVILILNLPMNMFLPVYSEYVHYVPESMVPPNKLVLRESIKESETNLQKWIIKNNFNDSILFTSYFGGQNTYLTYSRLYYGNYSDINLIQKQTLYIVFDQNMFEYRLWRSGDLSYEHIDLIMFLDQSSLLYNDGHVALFAFKNIN